MSQIRLIPLVLIAVSSLLMLKIAGIWFGGQTELQGVNSAYAQSAEPEAAADSADATAPEDGGEETATEIAVDPPSSDEAAGVNADGTAPADQVAEVMEGDAEATGARSAILARLAERRAELDAYQRELELRENLLDATEQRLRERLAELKEVEGRVQAAIGQREEEQQAQLEGLVVMYENMKPKDAARIFDRLDLNILLDVVKQMNARKMAAVLAAMEPEAAERLTVEIARDGRRAAVPMVQAEPGELPRVTSTN